MERKIGLWGWRRREGGGSSRAGSRVLPGAMLRGPTLGGPYMLGGPKESDRGGRLGGPGAKPTRTVCGAKLGGLESRGGGTSTTMLGSDFGVKLDGGWTLKAGSS